MEALSKALQRRRAYYNALFAEASQRNAELNGADVLEHLKRRVAPIFEALPALSDDAADRALEVLYRASLDLLSRRLVGERAPGSLNVVWQQLLPRVAPLIAIAPRRVVAALCNAAFNLDQATSARPSEWLGRMLAASEHCQDIETLSAVGQVAAWRSGLPQYRTVALEHCKVFSPAVLDATLGPVAAGAHAGFTAALLTRLQLSRFAFTPGVTTTLSVVAKLGGFTGYGGQFSTPPHLVRSQGALFAHDAETTWEVHADAFGTCLRRVQFNGSLSPDASSTAFQLTPNGNVQWFGLRADFPEIAEATTWACDDELLAVVPPRSHYVYLLAAAGNLYAE